MHLANILMINKIDKINGTDGEDGKAATKSGSELYKNK